MIKTVVFDIDNTLYSYDKAHTAAFAKLTEYAERELGLSAEEFSGLHRETGAELKERMGEVAAVHNRTIRYQNMLERRGLPLHPHVLEMSHIYWDTLIEKAEVSAGAPEAMRGLRQRGVRIGIGTDMTAFTQFRKLEKLGLLSDIDFMVSSEEVGAEKPDPVFFAQCVDKAGCGKEECLFVGDNLEKDVLGAEKAGLQAVWYRPQGYEAGACVRQIHHFLEILDIISE
ncbi:HAD family hydrolase [Lachnospiraceae bacterium JLR.KK008]